MVALALRTGLGSPRAEFSAGDPKLGEMGGSHPCPVIRFGSPGRVGGENGRSALDRILSHIPFPSTSAEPNMVSYTRAPGPLA